MLRRFSAEEAERAGLISRVVPHDTLLASAVAVGEQIAAHSLPAIALAKECVNRSYESSLNDGLSFEKRLFHMTWGLKDREEGMNAFVEKRPPSWVDK